MHGATQVDVYIKVESVVENRSPSVSYPGIDFLPRLRFFEFLSGTLRCFVDLVSQIVNTCMDLEKRTTWLESLTASHNLKAKSRFPLKLSLCWNQSLPFAFTSVRAAGEVGLACSGRSSRYVRTAIPRPQSLSLMKGSLGIWSELSLDFHSLNAVYITYLTLISVQSFRSRSASPLRKSPASTTSIKLRSVLRTSEIKER